MSCKAWVFGVGCHFLTRAKDVEPGVSPQQGHHYCMLLMVKSSHTAVNFLRDSFLFRERRGKRSEHILLFQEIVGEDSVKYWVRKQEEGAFETIVTFFENIVALSHILGRHLAHMGSKKVYDLRPLHAQALSARHKFGFGLSRAQKKVFALLFCARGNKVGGRKKGWG